MSRPTTRMSTLRDGSLSVVFGWEQETPTGCFEFWRSQVRPARTYRTENAAEFAVEAWIRDQEARDVAP